MNSSPAENNHSPLRLQFLHKRPEADRVFFREDDATVMIYARIPSPAHECVSVKAEVNGQRAAVLCHGTIPDPRGDSVLSVRVQPAGHVRKRASLRVRLTLSNGQIIDGVGTAFPCTAFGPTQYEFPLRVVGVTWDDHWVTLQVYNESNVNKPNLAVESVFLDHSEITSRCILPDSLLPADRHRYQEDTRELAIPASLIGNRFTRVSVGYRLVNAKSQAAQDWANMRGTIDFGLVRGLEYVVGGMVGPYLRGSICLHNGGLRPPKPLAAIREAALRVRRSAPEFPLYVRMAEGQTISLLREVSISCDLIVAAPSDRMRYCRADAVEDFIRYHEQLDELKCPFVTSIVKDKYSKFSPEDLRWLALVALSEGSKGVLVLDPFQVNDASTEHGGLHDGFWSGDIDRLEELIVTSHKVAIAHTCNQAGLHISTLMCGPEKIALFVINKWCTRKSSQGAEPFYAVPRDGVAVNLSVGKAWKTGRAYDLSTGSSINVVADASGIRLQIPTFRLGRIIVIQREADRGKSQARRLVVRSVSERPTESLAVRPVSSPFVRLGRLQASAKANFAVHVQNTTNRQIHVAPHAVTLPESQPSHVAFQPCVLGPFEKGELRAEVTATAFTGRSVTNVQMTDETTGETQFHIFVDLESVPSLALRPNRIDFGTFAVAERLEYRRVAIQNALGKSRIAGPVLSESPIDVRRDPEGQWFEFRPKVRLPGRFSGMVRIAIGSENAASQTLEVPFTGNYQPMCWVQPNSLPIVAGGEVIARDLLVRHGANIPFAIESVAKHAPWISVSFDREQLRKEQIVIVNIRTSEASSAETSITIHIRDAKSRRQAIEVPIRMIALSRRVAASTNARSVNLRATITKARQLVATYQKLKLPPDAPAWVRMHAVLMFGSRFFEKSRNGGASKELLVSLLMSTEPDRALLTLRNGLPFPTKRDGLFDRTHHRDQLLHVLSMAGVPRNQRIQLRGKRYTVADLFQASRLEARLGGELSWTVSAYSQYLEPAETWRNKFGQEMSLGALVQTLLKDPDPICGGTHRLCAISRVVSRAELREDPRVDALWPRLETLLQRETALLRSRQKKDGCFELPAAMKTGSLVSSEWAHFPHAYDIWYTGHSLEWMAIGLNVEMLQAGWVVQAVQGLVNRLEHGAAIDAIVFDRQPVDSAACFYFGFLSHAVSGLRRWTERIPFQTSRFSSPRRASERIASSQCLHKTRYIDCGKAVLHRVISEFSKERED